MSKSRQPTLEFYDLGKAGQVVKKWEWKLRYDYNLDPISSKYVGRYYSLIPRPDGWYIQAHVGCAWDYATGYFDGDYIKEASLGHDILHWLIAKGVIDTKYNDAIDYEFKQILMIRGNIAPWRATILMKGVNLCDQKLTGIDRPVVRLSRGKRVKTPPASDRN